MTEKPSDSEEEYFARQEFERKKKLEKEARQKLAEEERTKLKERHYMHCPKCGMKLIEIDYDGILIDKCSSCDGVWLDAGELKAITEESGGRLGGFLNMFKK